MKRNISKSEAVEKCKRFVRRYMPRAKCRKRAAHWYLIVDEKGYRGDGRTAGDAWICAADYAITIFKCLSLSDRIRRAPDGPVICLPSRQVEVADSSELAGSSPSKIYIDELAKYDPAIDNEILNKKAPGV